MCGRYAIPKKSGVIKGRFDLEETYTDGNFDPTFNAAPGQLLPVVSKNSPKRGILMRWGFVPTWSTPDKTKFRPVNARNDKLNGGFYKDAFKHHRCLVPASGYYEWRKFITDGKEQKQPYYFTVKDEEIFSLGGFYSIHKDAEGIDYYTFCIITCEPNSLQKPIHDRMPLIIPRDKEDEWLDTEKPDKLVKSFDSDQMEVWRVGKWVSSWKEDGVKLIEKLPEE